MHFSWITSGTFKTSGFGTHNIFIHFPKNRNCEVCKSTQITTTPCSKRISNPEHRAQTFLWLDNSRSQSSQWRMWTLKQSSICNRGAGLDNLMLAIIPMWKLNLLRRHFPSRRTIQNSFVQNFSWESDKACEELSRNHCTSTLHRSQTNGIGEKAVRRIKVGTFAVLLQSGSDEK